MKDIRTARKSIFERVSSALENGLSKWYYSADQTIKYSAVFVTVLFFLCIVLSVKKRRLEIIYPIVAAGMILEITFLEFNGRVMARLIDLMMLIGNLIRTPLCKYIYTCKFLPPKVHIWRFCVLKRGKLKLSGGFAYKNTNNHGQFPSNSV